MGRKAGHKTGAEMRAAAWVARHPGCLLAPGSVIASLAELGPITTGGIAAATVVGGLGWMRAHPASFDRHAAPRLRAVRRRWSRYVGRRWSNVCEACDLVRPDRRTGRVLVPRVVRVASPTPTIDRITVRMVRGQSLRLWQDRQDELAAALNAEALGITRIKPQVLVLTVVRDNPFTDTTPATAIPDEADDVDLSRVVFGETEYGHDWTENAQSHLFGVGATGAGKSGLIWNPLRSMGPALRDQLVRVWMVDPKGGMETRRARPIFHRWADHVDDDDDLDDDQDDGTSSGYGGESALALIRAFRDDMRTTQQAVGADNARKFTLSRQTPLNLLIVDELAMVTALSDGRTVRELTKLLAEVMTQGRATGHFVWAFVQEPTKDIVPIRELFTHRVALRVTSASHVDMALGDGARLRGALADEIPADDEHTGIGYRVDARTRSTTRVRAGEVTDTDIDELVRTCTPPEQGGMGQVVQFPAA